MDSWRRRLRIEVTSGSGRWRDNARGPCVDFIRSVLEVVVTVTDPGVGRVSGIAGHPEIRRIALLSLAAAATTLAFPGWRPIHTGHYYRG